MSDFIAGALVPACFMLLDGEITFSPSDLSWSTKDSTSLPLPPNFIPRAGAEVFLFRKFFFLINIKDNFITHKCTKYQFFVTYCTGVYVGGLTSFVTFAISPTAAEGVYELEPKPPLLPNEVFPPFFAASILCRCNSFAFSLILCLASRSCVYKVWQFIYS